MFNPEDVEVNTVDSEQTARQDAERDMGEDLDSLLKEKFLKDMRLRFSASFLVFNREEDRYEHGIVKHIALSEYEAIGRIYEELTLEYPIEEGWSSPSILMDDQPSLLLPGLGLPIGVDASTLFEE